MILSQWVGRRVWVCNYAEEYQDYVGVLLAAESAGLLIEREVNGRTWDLYLFTGPSTTVVLDLEDEEK